MADSTNATLTAIRGIEVGHWTDEAARTGVTVMTFPEPNVAAVEVRGGAPGSRETALLAPGMRVNAIQALVFAGGSAFGLAAADGVVRQLAADGRGHPTPVARIPIVPAAIIFDLGVGDPEIRPGPNEGSAAYAARSSGPVELGGVGAGTGASVGIWRGLEHVTRSGLGSAVAASDEAAVAALVVLNAAGDVFTLEGEALTGASPVPGPPAALPTSLEHTTLVALATDAQLDRAELSRLIVRSHDALGTCIRPAHTLLDGDIVFAVACGMKSGEVEALSEAAYVATARAIEVAFRSGNRGLL